MASARGHLFWPPLQQRAIDNGDYHKAFDPTRILNITGPIALTTLIRVSPCARRAPWPLALARSGSS